MLPTISVEIDHDDQIIVISTTRTDFDVFAEELQEAIECHFACITMNDGMSLN